MHLDELSSQLEVRDLTARFSDAVNRRDADALAALFTADGAWQVPGLAPLVGHDAIRGFFAGVLQNFEAIVQLSHSGHVEVDGDDARATWYVSELTKDVEGNASTVALVYTDTHVHTEEGWRFADRTCAFLHQRPLDPPGDWQPHPRAV